MPGEQACLPCKNSATPTERQAKAKDFAPANRSGGAEKRGEGTGTHPGRRATPHSPAGEARKQPRTHENAPGKGLRLATWLAKTAVTVRKKDEYPLFRNNPVGFLRFCPLNLQRQNEKRTIAEQHRKAQKRCIMTENAKEIMLLRYRIERYQEMGNGVMCQSLRRQLQKKLANGLTTK